MSFSLSLRLLCCPLPSPRGFSLRHVLLFPISLWSGLFCFYLVPSLWLPCGSSLVLWSGFVYMQMQTVWVVCVCWSVCVWERSRKGGKQRDKESIHVLYVDFGVLPRLALVSPTCVIYHAPFCLGFGSRSSGDFFFFLPPQCRTLCAVSFTQLPRITLLQGSPTHTAHCCTRHLVPRCFNLFVSVGLWLTCFINKFSQCFRFAPLMSGLLLFVYFGIRKTFCHAYFCFHAQVFILDAHIHTHSKIYFVNVMYYFEGNLSDDF